MKPWASDVEVQAAVSNLARDLAEFYNGTPFTMLVVLDGAFIFAADLLRELADLDVHPYIHFIKASSYGNEQVSSGFVKVDFHGWIPKTYSVLLIDDICDTGRTLQTIDLAVGDILKDYYPQLYNVESCVLINNTSFENSYTPLFSAFERNTEKFFIGYGMDDKGIKRGLSSIYTLE